MSISLDSLSLLVVLLPGFLSSIVLSHLVVRAKPDTPFRVVEALLFSLFYYSVMSTIFDLQPSFGSTDAGAALVENARFSLAAFPIAVLLPMALSWLNVKNYHMKLLHKMGVTRRTARGTPWLDVFLDQERYIVCNLSDGRRVFGWPEYYSEAKGEQLLYLRDPAWITNDGEYQDLNAHGLFLVKRDYVDSIVFTNLTRHNARARKEGATTNAE